MTFLLIVMKSYYYIDLNSTNVSSAINLRSGAEVVVVVSTIVVKGVEDHCAVGILVSGSTKYKIQVSLELINKRFISYSS